MAGIDRLLASLQTRGVRKGIFGSSRAWLWITVASWGIRRIRRANQPQLIYRGKLKPGQTLQISQLKEIVEAAPRRRRRRS